MNSVTNKNTCEHLIPVFYHTHTQHTHTHITEGHCGRHTEVRHTLVRPGVSSTHTLAAVCPSLSCPHTGGGGDSERELERKRGRKEGEGEKKRENKTIGQRLSVLSSCAMVISFDSLIGLVPSSRPLSSSLLDPLNNNYTSGETLFTFQQTK